MKFYLTLFFTVLFFSFGFARDKNNIEIKSKFFPEAVVDLATFEKSAIVTAEIFADTHKIAYYFGNIENALKHHLQVLKWIEENGTENEIFKVKNYVLGLYSFLSIDAGIVKTAKSLLNYSDIENEPSIVSILYTLKEVYRRTEQFEDLLSILPRYHQFSKKYGYIYMGEHSVYNDVAYVHYSLKNYDKAIKAYKGAAKEMEDGGDPFHQSSQLNNIGLCFYNDKKNDSAIYYYDKALKLIADKVLLPNVKNGYAEHFVNVIYANKAEILLNQGELDSTLPIFIKELNSGKKFSEFNIVVGSYYNIARIFYLKNQPKIAIKYIDSTLSILKKYHDVKVKKLALNLKARSYLHLNEYKKANLYFDIYQKYVDSLDAVKARKNYMIDVVKHETNEKESALLVSREQLKLKEKENLYQRLVLFIFAFIVLGLLFIYSRMRRGHRIIASQKMEVDKALEEKDVLLKEIHHRIKNNLQVVSSLLHVHSSKIQNKDFEELLDQSQRQIHSMSLVHEMLYQRGSVAMVPMQSYLNELCQHLLSTFSNKVVCTEINAGDISLSIDLANPIGLIINELVTNSLKYAFKNNEGTIKIELSKNGDTYTFTFKDTGDGINNDKKNTKTIQFGKRLIILLAEEMNAELKEYYDHGLTYVFVFKDKFRNNLDG